MKQYPTNFFPCFSSRLFLLRFLKILGLQWNFLAQHPLNTDLELMSELSSNSHETESLLSFYLFAQGIFSWRLIASMLVLSDLDNVDKKEANIRARKCQILFRVFVALFLGGDLVVCVVSERERERERIKNSSFSCNKNFEGR